MSRICHMDRMAGVAYILCASLLCGAGADSGWCAEGDAVNPNDEAKQYDQEEKDALEQLGSNSAMYTDFTGKVTLFTQQEIEARGDTTVVGKFESDGNTYLVKPMNDVIRKELVKLNGQSCTLHAKIRNAGKYIYVKSLTMGGAANDFTRRRGGL